MLAPAAPTGGPDRAQGGCSLVVVDSPPGTSARRRARWPWWVGAAVVLLTLGYVGTCWAGSTRVPRGVVVDGTQVGGMSPAAARAELEAQLGPLAARPVPVTTGDGEGELDPRAAGLTLDLPGTVRSLVGFSLDPRDLWRHLSGGSDVVAHRVVDRTALTTALTGLAASLDRPPADGAVTFADGVPVVTAPRPGLAVDVEAASTAVAASWWPRRGPVRLPVTRHEPAIDATDVQRALTSFATPATAGPLTVVAGGRSTQLPAQVVATALRLDPVDGDLAPAVDGEVLVEAVLAAEPGLAVAPQDATVALSDGGPVVVPAATGASIDPVALAAATLPALLAPDRTARVDVVLVEPSVSTAQAQALGITQVVSEFATPLTADAGRTENITIAARTVDGTVLAPGEAFSLNETLGRRTPEKGYNQAPVIVGGRLTRDYGGGVSQVATTLFNGMFFAGLRDVEHKPHSFYISRYPEGREATVNYGSVDLKFRNDTPHGVLIQMFVSGGQVHTRFWSTKVWDVDAEKGPRRNVTQPGQVVDSGPGCISQGAQAGFDVTVTRIFSQGGQRVRTEEFRTRYLPEDQVVCG